MGFGDTWRSNRAQPRKTTMDPKYQLARLERDIARKQASAAKLRGEIADQEAEAEDTEQPTRDDAMNRVVVKFFWQQFGKVTDPDLWSGKGGVISLIRHRMKSAAPSVEACRRTLERLAVDENDDVSRKMLCATHWSLTRLWSTRAALCLISCCKRRDAASGSERKRIHRGSTWHPRRWQRSLRIDARSCVCRLRAAHAHDKRLIWS